MTDIQFNAWLGGFFDGEGCVYIPKTPGIELNISGTNQALIRQLQKRLGLGSVGVTVFKNRDWNTKYSLRVRTYEEARLLIERIRPFLTIKGVAADGAMSRIQAVNAKIAARRSRNAEVMRLRATGMTHQAIADKMGMTRPNVSIIDKWIKANGNISMPGRDRRKARKEVPIGVKTISFKH